MLQREAAGTHTNIFLGVLPSGIPPDEDPTVM